MKIMNIVARWPDSVHDSTIFNHSNLKHEFEHNQYSNYLLLGKSVHSFGLQDNVLICPVVMKLSMILAG